MVAESKDLVTHAGLACLVGFAFFLASFANITCRRSKLHHELPKLQLLISCHRAVSGGFILLLIPLFWGAASEGRPVIIPITSYGNGSSWNFGWGRPVLHFCFAFLGMFVDSNSAARVSCLVGMAQAILFDTLSSYDLGTQIDCVGSGRCAIPENNTMLGLRLLHARDLISVVLATWALLSTYYLCLAVGVRRRHFTFRQLHAGDHNRVLVMQKELAKTRKWTGNFDNML